MRLRAEEVGNTVDGNSDEQPHQSGSRLQELEGQELAGIALKTAHLYPESHPRATQAGAWGHCLAAPLE